MPSLVAGTLGLLAELNVFGRAHAFVLVVGFKASLELLIPDIAWGNIERGEEDKQRRFLREERA